MNAEQWLESYTNLPISLPLLLQRIEEGLVDDYLKEMSGYSVEQVLLWRLEYKDSFPKDEIDNVDNQLLDMSDRTLSTLGVNLKHFIRNI